MELLASLVCCVYIQVLSWVCDCVTFLSSPGIEKFCSHRASCGSAKSGLRNWLGSILTIGYSCDIREGTRESCRLCDQDEAGSGNAYWSWGLIFDISVTHTIMDYAMTLWTTAVLGACYLVTLCFGCFFFVPWCAVVFWLLWHCNLGIEACFWWETRLFYFINALLVIA